MSQRLTNEMRSQITHSVLCHRFTDEVELMALERAAFAEDVYNDVYRKADRDKMAALPAGWLPEQEKMSAKFGDHKSGYVQIEFTGGFYGSLLRLRKTVKGAREKIYKRVLDRHKGTCWKAYETDHKLTIRWEKFSARFDDLTARVDAADKQAEVALGSVTTLAALLKAWPEIEPLVQPHIPVVRSVPALPVQTLNEMFKLPVKKAA